MVNLWYFETENILQKILRIIHIDNALTFLNSCIINNRCKEVVKSKYSKGQTYG